MKWISAKDKMPPTDLPIDTQLVAKYKGWGIGLVLLKNDYHGIGWHTQLHTNALYSNSPSKMGARIFVLPETWQDIEWLDETPEPSTSKLFEGSQPLGDEETEVLKETFKNSMKEKRFDDPSPYGYVAEGKFFTKDISGMVFDEGNKPTPVYAAPIALDGWIEAAEANNILKEHDKVIIGYENESTGIGYWENYDARGELVFVDERGWKFVFQPTHFMKFPNPPMKTIHS